ncbi:hypothetical protein ACFPTY_09835 [Halomonas beimenensis]|uniref:Uncharacterized protein n=1 Tax=Halomonas beimenensis TaxID=475662 RepID=A0A291P8U8_9GAMM|nr:hypothetical protein [Halomonas beimenensis]ATJ83305.1 hypothetical protein BEI_2318 [Halomonas beimenensis]
MNDIELLPSPLGHWMMMCPCGAAELRSPRGPAWATFELRTLADHRYRITCCECGHVTEQSHHRQAALEGSAPLD